MAHPWSTDLGRFSQHDAQDARNTPIAGAISAPGRLALSVAAALQNVFSESDLPWRVDVVDWASAAKAMQHRPAVHLGQGLLTLAAAPTHHSAVMRAR
ncbi:MAG: hypothetical protein ACOZD0_12860 [Pseudomonadota bacterium]